MGVLVGMWMLGDGVLVCGSNMLVGVLDPSAGTVLVEGKKTYGRTGLLGICPQHNIIFE